MLLALSVPTANDRGPQYMEQALAAIHQANPSSLPVDLELGSLDGAVTLFCRMPDELSAVVEQQLYAAYPDLRLIRVPEHNPANQKELRRWTLPLMLKPDLYPLKRYGQFEDSLNRQTADPLTAILIPIAATATSPLRCRIIFSICPAPRRRRLRAEKCLRRLARPLFRAHPRLAHLYAVLAMSPRIPLRLCGWIIGRLAREREMHDSTRELHLSTTHLHERESDLQAAQQKVSGLLFETRINLIVSAPSRSEAQARAKLRQMAGAFGIFHAAGLASFHALSSRPDPRKSRLSQRTSFLLSTEELATLFHLPTVVARAPTLATVSSRELEPPVTLPTPARHRALTLLGMTTFRGRNEHFGILPDDRRRHLLIEGKTGMGKTTLLQNLIVSDIHAGRGVGLLDPHGDLCDALLAMVPPSRTNDVVLFDAGDSDHPIAFNILHCEHPGQRALLASGIVSAFKKLYRDSWGPRMEHILRNAVLALIEIPDSTLLSLLRLLSDARYRTIVTSRLSDPVVRSFWQQEFPGMPPRLQAEAIAPVQNKIGAFLAPPLLRNIIGQRKNSLDLRRIMDNGRILLVNLSKGRTGEDASALLGSFLVTAIQLAAMNRADCPEQQRTDFSLYIDEFQNYSTESFATILSEARKYRLNLTVANQYLAQMDDTTRSALFGNVGTVVSFQVGAEDTEVLTEQLGGDLQPQDLLALPRYTAYVRLLIDGLPSKPFSMQTFMPRTLRTDPKRADIIRRYSRQRYARPIAHVDDEIARSIRA